MSKAETAFLQGRREIEYKTDIYRIEKSIKKTRSHIRNAGFVGNGTLLNCVPSGIIYVTFVESGAERNKLRMHRNTSNV